MTSPPAIVTLTVNPALDVSTSVEAMSPGHKLRGSAPQHDPGGGGVNVSRVCQRLDELSTAVVALGGLTGERVRGLLEREGVAVRAVPVSGETRQCLEIAERATDDEYRVILPSPTLSDAETAACTRAIIEEAAGARCTVISGSVPGGGEGADLFAEVVRALPDTAVIIDTSGPALHRALMSGAYLVKPSARELAAVAGRTLRSEADVEEAARQVMADSRVEVLAVSIGAGGVLIVPSSGRPFRVRAPAVEVRSTSGAGDSLVAGLAVGVARDLGLKGAVALGVAAGTAAVLSEGTMLCGRGDVDAMLALVTT